MPVFLKDAFGLRSSLDIPALFITRGFLISLNDFKNGEFFDFLSGSIRYLIEILGLLLKLCNLIICGN